MSMPCPKCGAEVYREDNYECFCEDQQDDDGQKEWVPNLAEYRTLARRCEKLESQLTEATDQLKLTQDSLFCANQEICKQKDELTEAKARIAELEELNHGLWSTISGLEGDAKLLGIVANQRSALQAQIKAAVEITQHHHHMAEGEESEYRFEEILEALTGETKKETTP